MSDSTTPARRLLLRHPPGLDIERREALAAALQAAAARQQELASQFACVYPVGGLEHDDAGFWILDAGDDAELENLIERAPLPADEVARLGVSLCAALLTVCYPDNAMPRPHGALRPVALRVADGRVRVSELGVAAALTGVLGPTGPREELDLLAAYLPREMWLNPDATGEQRDLFAVGVMLYELATGKHPYRVDRHDYNTCEQRILLGRAVPAEKANTALNATFAAVLDRACAPREEDRFPSLKALRDALLTFAGAEALALAERLPPEALRVSTKEGLPAQAAAATLAQRFCQAVVEQSGLLRGDAAEVHVAERAAQAPENESVAVQVTLRGVSASPVALDLKMASREDGLHLLDPATPRGALVEALAEALRRPQRDALAQLAATLADGALPGTEVTGEAGDATPTRLASFHAATGRGALRLETLLRWDVDVRAWREEEPGGLQAAAAAAIGELFGAALQRDVIDASPELSAERAALGIDIAISEEQSAFPEKLVLVATITFAAENASPQPLESQTITLPTDWALDFERMRRRTERALRKLRGDAGKTGGANAGMILGGAAVLVVVGVVAGMLLFRGGGGSGTPNTPPEPNEPNRIVRNGGDGNAPPEPNDTPDPNVLAAQREAKRVAGVRQEFDDAIAQTADLHAPNSDRTLLSTRDALSVRISDLAPLKPDLTDAQQKQLAALQQDFARIDALGRAAEAASASGAPADIAALAKQAGAALDFWNSADEAPRAALTTLAALMPGIAAEDADAFDRGARLRLAQQQVAALSDIRPLYDALLGPLDRLRANLKDARLVVLQQASASAASWVSQNGAPPNDWRDHLRAADTAADARKTLDTLNLLALPAEPSPDTSLDGLLEWADLDPGEQETIATLDAWTRIDASVPAPDGDAAAPPLAFALAIVPGVDSGKPVWMSRDEVSGSQFVAAGIERRAARSATDVKLPAGFVSSDDALNFCFALEQRLQAAGVSTAAVRLPTADEWARALFAGVPADAPNAILESDPGLRRYTLPGGDMSFDPAKANFSSGDRFAADSPLRPAWTDGYADMAPNDAFPPNRWGFANLLGNLQEWVESGLAQVSESRGGGYRTSIDAERLAQSPLLPDRPRGTALEDVGLRFVVTPTGG